MESDIAPGVTGLAGKTALITGAGRGIGRALAFGLAAQGVRLVLLARSKSQLAQTASDLTAAGAAEPLVVPADVADDRQRQAVVAAAYDVGRIDILVNNAATVEPLGSTAGLDVTDIRSAFDVNVVAELAGTGVTVNAYRPGGVDTAMQAWIRRQDPARIGASLRDQFARTYASGTLLTRPALGHLPLRIRWRPPGRFHARQATVRSRYGQIKAARCSPARCRDGGGCRATPRHWTGCACWRSPASSRPRSAG
ncbi:MAG TPA: SDR family NAD(P)-dependent oxidoreductase [Streptosporangiaceae bacterium]|jgi:NAD(P)-dependent dehydrogenase (short-subunit alcohol dehydrogenase family)